MLPDLGLHLPFVCRTRATKDGLPVRSVPSPLDLRVGWPMASAVGDANFNVEFVFPTSKEMGHPFLCNPKIGK